MASGHVQDVWGDMGKLDLPNSDEMQPCGLKAGTCSYGRGLRSWNRVLTPTNSRKRRRRDLQALAGNSSTQTSLGLAIADPTTYWPAADVHVRCFYHQTQKKNIERKGNQHALFRGLFDRIDRAIALQVNDALAARAGNNVLLVAYLGDPLPGNSDEAKQAQAQLEAEWLGQAEDGQSDNVVTSSSRASHRQEAAQVKVAGWYWVNGPLAQITDVTSQQSQQLEEQQQQAGRPGLSNLLQGAVELAQSLLPFSKESPDSDANIKSSSSSSSSASLSKASQVSSNNSTGWGQKSSVSEDSPFLGASGPLRGVPPTSLDMAARMLRPDVRPGVGVCAEACNIVGVANLDAFGDLVPPRTLNPLRDGAFGWIKREGVAYVSNMAVLPQARRMGTARALMEAAEQLAIQWGCRSVGLHCNPNNAPALRLYRSMGYHRTPAIEAPWVPYLQGRPPDRCVFMLKLLPAKARAQYQQQLQEQQERESSLSAESQLASVSTLPS